MTTDTKTGVKGLCFPYNLEESNFDAYFPQLPNKFPPNYICHTQKRDGFNKILDERREARVRNEGDVTNNIGHQISPSSTWRMKEISKDNKFDSNHVKRGEVLQLGGRGDMFYGYAQNVDVESELKRINYKYDRCFYDNYKVNPEDPNSSLHKYKNIIRKDYLSQEKGTYLDPQLNPMSCLKGASQSSVIPYVVDEDKYKTITSNFNNDPVAGYPPQKLWHNVTKRRMLYSNNSHLKTAMPVSK
jgi:hypothetical protein